jgi:hypothetical protein
MKLNSQIESNVYVNRIDLYGNITTSRHIHNIIASTGLTPAVKCIIGSSGGGSQPAAFNWVGYGTSTQAGATSNTALIGEIGTRLQDTNPAFPAAGQGRLTVTFGTGDTGTISESGVFNSSAGSILLARSTFTGVVKGTDDSIQIIWDFTLTS